METVEYELKISQSSDQLLRELAKDNHLTIDELLVKAVLLMKWVLEGKKLGNEVIMTDQKGEQVGKVVGI